MWQACQLVNAGDDSASATCKSLERIYTEKLDAEKVKGDKVVSVSQTVDSKAWFFFSNFCELS